MLATTRVTLVLPDVLRQAVRRGDQHGDRILRNETCSNDTRHFGIAALRREGRGRTCVGRMLARSRRQ